MRQYLFIAYVTKNCVCWNLYPRSCLVDKIGKGAWYFIEELNEWWFENCGIGQTEVVFKFVEGQR